ncbi:hypothetical protein OG782_16275 [Streptomyces sp. NBC_00876]|uniref:hypothetical protein n=1 Tax=Streptomyces sp. NBC_00876 TaxID=2975853 RepID=UPI00386B8035|nr:hypothetical protein OG782_16275 [Streptomyces sp. NBC_00876]
MPIGDESDLFPAGQWWDAIRAPEAIGRRAIELLIEASHPVGPVILDSDGLEPRLYFLTVSGASVGWDEPGTVALGRTCHVVVPSADRMFPPGLHWYNVPAQPHTLAQPDTLRRALAMARREQQGAAAEPDSCP